MNHAKIKLGDMEIPLIGIPECNVLEECDCCHDFFGLQDITLTGTQFLCKVCQDEK